MLNPMRNKNSRHVPGGRRDDTCDHGLSRRSLRVNLLRVELESESDDQKKKKTCIVCRSFSEGARQRYYHVRKTRLTTARRRRQTADRVARKAYLLPGTRYTINIHNGRTATFGGCSLWNFLSWFLLLVSCTASRNSSGGVTTSLRILTRTSYLRLFGFLRIFGLPFLFVLFLSGYLLSSCPFCLFYFPSFFVSRFFFSHNVRAGMLACVCCALSYAVRWHDMACLPPLTALRSII